MGRMAVTGLRWDARWRRRPLRPGVTVVTVNWNSVGYLEVLVGAVRRFSPPGTSILVVDNGSTDGTAAYLQAHRELRRLRLPWNAGHARAMDMGCLLVDTEFLVTLDVDAFPIRDDWLEKLLAPLDDGFTIAGAHLNRDYVHPCCLAMRTLRFRDGRLSFRDNYANGAGDVGEQLCAADGGPLFYLEKTIQYGPGDVGTVFGDVVYHNFYSTRFGATSASTLDGEVGRDDPARAWDRAVREFLS